MKISRLFRYFLILYWENKVKCWAKVYAFQEIDKRSCMQLINYQTTLLSFLSRIHLYWKQTHKNYLRSYIHYFLYIIRVKTNLIDVSSVNNMILLHKHNLAVKSLQYRYKLKKELGKNYKNEFLFLHIYFFYVIGYNKSNQ